ncbi:hypothetical protein GCM10009126_15300 [Rhodanobacter caeni]|uniref:Ankyrin repeat domain-containing protein n=2 Tax=Rhodanobacter caeni TaxID=657654 RepID=A0ABP3E5J4_9GAMM
MTEERNAMDRPPYPRIGELYRALAGALDTKGKDRAVDRLAREGEFDWTLLPELREGLVMRPIRDATDDAFAGVLARFVDRVHAGYLDLVAKVPLDSLNRDDALPLLVEHYFAYEGAGLLLDIKEKFGGPDLMVLLDLEKHPLAVVLDWLNQHSGVDLVRTVFPDSTGEDRSDRELISSWTSGGQIPDLASIKRVARVVWERAGDAGRQRAPALRHWMVVARALCWFQRESSLPIRTLMGRHLLAGLPELDLGHVLSVANHREGVRFSALKMPALQLYEDLKRTTPKAPGDQGRIRERLDAFEQLAKVIDPEGRTRYHRAWLYGRWHALSARFDEALDYYEEAVELAHYRAGDQEKQIVEETMVLAALVGNQKALLKRLKHRAVAFGLFVEPRGDAVIEDWEVEHLRRELPRLFPPHGMFPEAPEQKVAPMAIPMIAAEDLDRLAPDLRNPDRVRTVCSADGQRLRRPQLHFFVSLGRVDDVQTLLDRGASVDQLDASMGSALLCALQRFDSKGDRGPLDVILQRHHAKATLDSVTSRKRHTALISAVRSGAPDIVEALLAMGATADQRGMIENVTPLYCCITFLGLLGAPRRQLPVMQESVRREHMRRYGVLGAGTFGDAQSPFANDGNPRHQRIHQELKAAIDANQFEKLSEPKILRMVESLLRSGANPNVAHDHPVSGRTP